MKSARILAGLMVISLTLHACGDSEPPFDILITGGTVYDGSLSPPQQLNIGIRGDRIVRLDAAADAPAKQVIDAAGKVVSPGFIDPHTHARADLLDAATSSNLNYLMQGVTTVFIGNDGDGLRERRARVQQMRTQGIGTNMAFFAGHGDLREQVMGLENRAPTAAELAAMQRLLAEEMRAGALGLSTGLFYTPGSFADTDEVIALSRTAAEFGGVYDTHMRSESAFDLGLLESVGEVLKIAEATGIPVHISHLKALGRDVWGQSGDIIALIDAARARGLNVTANQYPYRASGTRFSSALVPQWARADSREAMYARFDNPDLADRLRAEMQDNLRIRGGAGAMLVTGNDSEWRGQTLDEIAESLGADELDAAVHVIRNGDPSIASFVMEQQDIHAIAIQPWVMTGSDGSPGHPRKYGTYPQVYRDMVLEHKLFPIERFVHRSSGLVADTFGLCDRGYLQPGRKADVVILDLQDYAPRADFQNPEELAMGVTDVIINGQLAVRAGAYANTLPGEIVNHAALECSN
jgi:N-acyl-D-aspartate/D-glutamate deacylase